jgi:hypothetical protein
MTQTSIKESGNKVKGEIRVKKIISARVLGGMAAMLLVVASIIGLNQQTDTAQAASTGTINLVNNWSKLSTATSPSKLATGYGGTTPSYVGSGKSLYATFTSTGRHIMTGSNQLVIEVVDSDLNSAVVKSTVIILKGGHSASSTLITNYQTEIGDTGKNEYAIPIIDNNSDGVVNGADLTFACRWIGGGYEDEDGNGSSGIGTAFYSEAVAVTARTTADSLLDGTSIANGATGATAANILTDATAATTTLGALKQRTDMTVVRTGTEAALMGSFNAAPKCSTATTTLVSVALIGSAGDPVGGVSAQIQVSTPTSIASHSSQAWAPGGEQAGATNLTTSVIAGLVQWKTSRINTTTAKVWSGVVSQSNAINVLLTETGRNTGVFNGLVNLFDNENTAMPLGMAANNATTNDAESVYFGSFGNTNAEAPCAGDCAAGLGRAATSDTSTLAVKDGGTVYAEYVDAVDADSNTSQKRSITAKVDATTPTVEINSPAHSSENQTRTPTFSLTATEAASGLDVSGSLLILQEGSEQNNSGEDGSVGGNGTDVMTTSALHDATGNDEGAGGDWLTSSIFALTGGDITLGSSTDEDGNARTAASVTVNRGTSTDGVSSLTYTYTPSAALPLGAATPVDHWIDYQGVATDLAGNVGYTDSNTSVSAGVLEKFGAHHIKIDQKLPSISAAYTGWWWDTSIDSANKTHKHTSTKANSLVVEFDGNITDIDATDFQITFDDGTTHTPTEAVIYSALKAQVFLTLGASMPADDTPKVALVGSVSDMAGNSTSTGSLAGATDKIHPAVTATLSGGTGTGTAALEGVNDLTKTTIVLTVTTDEELVSNPKVDIYDLGMAKAGQGTDNGYKGTCGVVDTCGMGSIVNVNDYNVRSLDVSVDPPATSFTVDRNGGALTPASTATVDATSAAVLLDAGMTAQGTKTFKYTINASTGTPGTDGEKTVVVTATDKATQGNITIHGSISSTSSYLRFMLDDTAPSLTITPTSGSTTTQTKPYIVLDYSAEEATKVTLNTATLDGVDISGKLSSTDNKKFYYVPESDLAAGEHTIVSKATDYAGNVSSILTRKFSVAARKDFKMSLLAGWNAKSVPSDPVDPSIDAVFSNAGVDMVLSYSDHTWSSATKDAGSGKFVGSLSEIHSGHGYWVHNNNFESQSVALVGPVAPSAGSPPAVVTIPTVAGWNFVGVSDVTRANTEGADGATITTQTLYFGDLTDGTPGGHDIVYKYDTTNLAFVEVASGTNVLTGQGLWIYLVPESDGSILPIVPPAAQ